MPEKFSSHIPLSWILVIFVSHDFQTPDFLVMTPVFNVIQISNNILKHGSLINPVKN